jgi:hypothetical protein
MAKNKAEEQSETTSRQRPDNIENLTGLTKEFLGNKMEARKTAALRVRLVELHVKETASEGEESLLESILKRDRLKAQLSDSHAEILNRIEMDRCEERCIVKSEHVPSVHYIQKDMICPFLRDHDNDKIIVFVERTIPGNQQMDIDLAERVANKLPYDPNEMPKKKVMIHRLSVTEREFSAWFEEMDDDILKDQPEKEAVYSF